MAQLTEQELQDFQALRQEASKLAAALGEIHFQRVLINLELDKIEAAIAANASTQQALLKTLGEKYGDGSINLQTGEVTVIPAN